MTEVMFLAITIFVATQMYAYRYDIRHSFQKMYYGEKNTRS